MYLDSCIIVKLLVVEPDSEFFIQALEGKPTVTSELAQTEVFSALLARERAGTISKTDRRRAWHEFEARVAAGEIKIEPLNSVVLHLATADMAHNFPLTTTDRRLRDAATLLGFEIFPPAENAPAN